MLTRRSSDRLVAKAQSPARGKALAMGTGQVRDTRKRNVGYEGIKAVLYSRSGWCTDLYGSELGCMRVNARLGVEEEVMSLRVQ